MNSIKQIATDLLSQYGDDAESIVMLRAAEFAATLNTKEWRIWEAVIDELRAISSNLNLH
ncbi:MAG: hypothetical protein P8L73_03915 [SAR86 cluster bacterium]|jgi:hypothetical protein|nr:hypothetical protein [SAR86 cluster bacterium]